MRQILQGLRRALTGLSLPQDVGIIDLVQVLLIAVVVYYFILWIKQTRAYTLFKGIILIGVVVLVAQITGMETILWIFKNVSTVILVALVVIFQPELRKMLEQLGEKYTFSMLGGWTREINGVVRVWSSSIVDL